jgi:uncharacterized SAM-binding protein YcdF (DUF218 family)
MLFDVSKIGWLFAAPSRVLLLLALLGVLAGRRGRGVALAALGLIAAAAILPVGGLALARLETTFPRFAPPGRLDGIIVIGGALDNADFDAYPASGFTPAFGRLYEAARLAKLYPQARLFDVGGPTPPAPGRAEADEAADVLVALGVPRERIEIERQSRNTFENAVDARALAKPQAGQIYALVTSAFHMPRAVGCFRQAGFSVIADPVDYRWQDVSGLGFDVVGGLESLDLAVHEYFGLASYYALGRTDALWPGP